MKIALVISSLGRGGAERVLSMMANWYAENGHPVTVITLDEAREGEWPLEPKVERMALGLMQASASTAESVVTTVRRIGALRRAILRSGAGVVVSFVDRTNVLALMAARGTGIPVIVSERSNPDAHPAGRATDALRLLTYPHASGIVVQTEAVRRWAAARFSAARVTVVPNPVEFPAAVAPQEGREPVVLGVGRLGREKGFDLLVRAFAGCGEPARGWRLRILGEGIERESLHALARELGIADRLSLAGPSTDVAGELQRASIFALPSRYEGFPNALLEAMAAGTAAVAFDCEHGPREIIDDRVTGLLVPPGDVGALSQALDRLAASVETRRKLAEAARRASRRYAIDAVMQRWGEIIADAGAPRG